MPADLHEQVESSVLASLDAWFEATDKNPSTRVPPVASLFGINKLREVARKIDTDQIQDELAIVRTWHADYHTGTLKKDKETSREQAYNQDFFMKILGYKEKPATPYTFEPKATTDKRQLPDAVLCFGDASVKNIAAVVELKDASTLLDRPQQREGNMSPVQQGFKYKTQYRVCPFVVVSNFFEFRLYNDNQLDYERWTLDDLVDSTDDYLTFKTWYVLLQCDNFTSSHGPSKTEELLTDIRIEQEEIGKKFYLQYQSARTELLKDVWTQNPSTRFQFDLAIQKAQTIIDRIVFICFAEDRGLLPDNIVARTIEYADRSPFGKPLFDHLKDFFAAIDKGSKNLEIPDGYNGGLFAKDPWIDALKISDAPLRRLAGLGRYDFQEDLSVTILGHIFEQSITDLEEIKRKVADDKDPFGVPAPEPKVGRRKKEGIFYTPDYIVRHIVNHSLGAFLREKEAHLLSKHKLTGRLGEKGYEQRERAAYLEYQHILQNIKVLDPSCGSGAFLVYVFDYLLAENRRVDDILGGGLYSFDDYVRNILGDNIFGVDLNEESVEITKLSLWLKTAEKGKPLTSLDANIRVGNSVLSDPSAAGDLAFDWDEEFAHVKRHGGFDVIVGNPPWGAEIPHEIRGYFRKEYPIVEKQVEIYMAFIARGIALLAESGYLSFITPSTWLAMHYFKKLRRLVLDETEIDTATLITYQVFEDVTAETAIFALKKGKPTEGSTVKFSVARTSSDFDRLLISTVAQSEWSANYLRGFNLTVTGDYSALINKLFAGKSLAEYVDVKNGMKPYCTGKGEPLQTKEMVKARLYDADHQVSPRYKNYIVGKHIHQFWVEPSDMWIEYGPNLAEPRSFGFEQPKIVMRQTSDRIIAAYDENNLYNLNNVHDVIARDGIDLDLKAITALLNSRLVDFIYNYLVPEEGRVFAEVKAVNIKKIPMPPIESLPALRLIHDDLVTAHQELNRLSSRFKSVLMAEFSIKQWPARAGEWWHWEYEEMIQALHVKLTLKRKADLMDYFASAKAEAGPVAERIAALRGDLDQAVYKAYSLTAKEIALVQTEEPAA